MKLPGKVSRLFCLFGGHLLVFIAHPLPLVPTSVRAIKVGIIRSKFEIVLLLVYAFARNVIIMKNLSLKLDEQVFDETEKIISEINVNRNRYINKAVAFFNQLQKKKILGQQLETESRLVQEESLKVLAEFEKLDDDATAI